MFGNRGKFGKLVNVSSLVVNSGADDDVPTQKKHLSHNFCKHKYK